MVPADVHAVADAVWDLLGAGLLSLPAPGSGATLTRWLAVAEVAAVDMAAARLVEGHLQAHAIFIENGREVPEGLWSVWADAGPAWTLTATQDSDGWLLTGVHPSCPGARSVTGAVVTARSDDGVRLFALPVRHPAVTFDPDQHAGVGMALADALLLRLHEAHLPPQAAIAEAGWYHARSGYWAAGVVPAAGWYGGALGLTRAVHAAMARGEVDDAALVHLGVLDASCAAMLAVLSDVATTVDGGDPRHIRTAAWQVRASITALAAKVMDHATTALGAGRLSHDPAVARRVADLTVSLRRHGAEREYRALGSEALDVGRYA